MKFHSSLVLLLICAWWSGLTGRAVARQASAATEPPGKPETKLDLSACIRVQKGELPIIISAPHGGTREIPDVDARKGEGMEKGASGFFTGRDVGTEQLALAVAAEIKKKLGREPWYVISRVHRKYVDFNRPAEIGFEDPDARPVYEHYHCSVAAACRAIAEEIGRAHV